MQSRMFCPILVAAIIVTLAVNGCTPEATKLFPDFAGRKGDLGSVALVADVVVVEDVVGSTEKIHLEESKQLGDLVLEEFEQGMIGKGYAIEKKPLLSVGQVVKQDAQYRVLASGQHLPDDSLPIQAPPFYVDATLSPDEEAEAAWSSLLQDAWIYEKEKGKPAAQLSGVAVVHDKLGTDNMLVVLVVGTKIPFSKQLGQGFLSALMSGGGSAGSGVTFSTNVDLTQFSGTACKVTMIDARTGDVLWSDNYYEEKNLKEDRVDDIVGAILKHLP